MKKNKDKINSTIEGQIHRILYQVLASTKSEIEIEQFLRSVMTEAEVLAVAKRLAIAVFLDKGQSYERIKDVLRVSSATIADVSENMDKKGLQNALQQIKAEEWADMWSIRLSRALEKLIKT